MDSMFDSSETHGGYLPVEIDNVVHNMLGLRRLGVHLLRDQLRIFHAARNGLLVRCLAFG